MSDDLEMLDRVSRALGRSQAPASIPKPPAMDESIARVVRRDANLVEIFSERSHDMHMDLAVVSSSQLVDAVVEFIRTNQLKKIALCTSGAVARLGLKGKLLEAGIDARSWDQITLDQLYDGFDCAITDVEYAVAETAGLIIRPTAMHGRALSLVPMFHIAIVEKQQLIPDMLDLMENLAANPDRSNFIMITGPSKTADIEMNVVTGVHGPNVVKTFILQ